MKTLLAVFAVAQLVIGALLWLTPGFFFDEIGPYGVRNDHYMGDLATWYLALGAAALVAVRRVGWRLPVLALAFLQNTLHAVNHLIDVGEADPELARPGQPRLPGARLAAARLDGERRTGEGRMRVFVAGASGAVGRPLVPMLVAAGHEVTGSTRSQHRAETIRAAGAEAAVVDALDAGALRRAVSDAAPEVVVHELTALPDRFDPRDPEIYAPTNRLRKDGTRNLIAAARAAGARRLVCQSIAFAYAPGPVPEVKDEDAPLNLGAPSPFGAGVRVIGRWSARCCARRGRRPGAALRLVLRPGHLLRRGRAHGRARCASAGSR